MNEDDRLLDYFERLTEQHTKPEFAIGVEMTRKWLILKERQSVSQSEFDGFFDRLEDIDSVGFGYFDLWIRVRHWAYELGLEVPTDHPWRVDRRNVICKSNDGFPEQLTLDKAYRKLAIDDERQLVRVRNNEGKHRWYPSSCFEPVIRPLRERTTKSEPT